MKYLVGILSKVQIIKRFARAIIPAALAETIRRRLDRNSDIRVVFGNKRVVIDRYGVPLSGVIPVLYWDGEPNFGDAIGPYLINKITGQPVINILDSKTPGFMTVGSILQRVDRKNMVVWGSGFIELPTEKILQRIKKYKPIVLSVRGKESARRLEGAGLKISNIDALGDPALVLPHFYNPGTSERTNRVAICPHFIHKSKFRGLSIDDKIFKIIDVQQDLEEVVSSISTSGVCISTSLHGLIVSQAYGVPWVWLEIVDNKLKGDDFKFKDFFSMLEEDEVVHIQVTIQDLPSLDFEFIASKANLPKKKYDDSLMLEVLRKHLLDCGFSLI